LKADQLPVVSDQFSVAGFQLFYLLTTDNRKLETDLLPGCQFEHFEQAKRLNVLNLLP